jgi:hypothetical protein
MSLQGTPGYSFCKWKETEYVYFIPGKAYWVGVVERNIVYHCHDCHAENDSQNGGYYGNFDFKFFLTLTDKTSVTVYTKVIMYTS